MADEQEEFGIKFAATAETVTEAKQAFAHLTEQMAETAKTGETLATTTKTVDDAAGELRKQIADLEEVLRKQLWPWPTTSYLSMFFSRATRPRGP